MVEQSELPPVLATIAGVAGVDAALKIARMYGGTRVTMPQSGRGRNWLNALVGASAADDIIDALGSTRRIDVPLGPEGDHAYSKGQRARKFAEMNPDASEAEMARALGVTGRAIRYRRARERQRTERGQGDLFE